MAENSKIEWTDHTFNPWRGCAKVSPGCANCYAETLSKRNPRVLGEWGKGKPRVLASEAMWRQPPMWNRVAASCRVDQGIVLNGGSTSQIVGRPDTLLHHAENRDREFVGDLNAEEWAALPKWRPRVFCASLADWLDDEVPIEWLARLLALIQDTPNLDWLLLTKRPQHWRSRSQAVLEYWTPLAKPRPSSISDTQADRLNWLDAWRRNDGIDPVPDNVWIGTSVEDQARADERIPALLQIPAKVRFLSCEPLLGPVDLRLDEERMTGGDGSERTRVGPAGIHWVIAGGESGPQARPMHPDWARSLRDQCEGAGVPFLFKQWGEFRPAVMWDGKGELEAPSMDDDRSVRPFADGPAMLRLGKKQAGRLLDGREWNGFPVTAQKGGRGA